jgi:hypothetical protein
VTTIKDALVRGVRVAEIKKPPQRARTERDRKWMEDWLKALLEQIYDEKWHAAEERLKRQTPEERKEMEDWLNQGESTWLAETHGIMESVREKNPRLAKLLNPPARPGKGKRFPKNKYIEAMSDPLLSRLSQAVWDAEQIRAIWKEHYRPKPKGYGSAEEIAARLWGVKAHQVYEWKASRQRPKRSGAQRLPLYLHYRMELERKKNGTYDFSQSKSELTRFFRVLR